MKERGETEGGRKREREGERERVEERDETLYHLHAYTLMHTTKFSLGMYFKLTKHKAEEKHLTVFHKCNGLIF